MLILYYHNALCTYVVGLYFEDYAICTYMECYGEPHVHTWALVFWTCPTVVAGRPYSHKAHVKKGLKPYLRG